MVDFYCMYWKHESSFTLLCVECRPCAHRVKLDDKIRHAHCRIDWYTKANTVYVMHIHFWYSPPSALCIANSFLSSLIKCLILSPCPQTHYGTIMSSALDITLRLLITPLKRTFEIDFDESISTVYDFSFLFFSYLREYATVFTFGWIKISQFRHSLLTNKVCRYEGMQIRIAKMLCTGATTGEGDQGLKGNS